MSKARVDTIANLNDDVQVDVALMVNRIYSNLGSKTSAPTVRNNGTPLVVGDTYFNTTTQADMTYFSSGWVKSLSATDVEDNLASVSALKVLSAKQGKILADAIVLVNQSIANTYTKSQVDLIKTNLETLAKNSSAPVGSIEAWSFSRATLPAGRIARDGQLLNRADWPDLWALVEPFTVGDATWLAAPYTFRGFYSAGNGTTTFRMPDTNGKHADGNTISAMGLRGDGKNSAGTPGVHQADQVQKMQFQVYRKGNGGTTDQGWVTGSLTGGELDSTVTKVTNVALAANPISDGVNGTPRVGSETRGSNETVIWCTVGAKTAVNTGTVDVVALASTVSSQATQIQSKLDSNSPLISKAFARIIGGTTPSIVNSVGVVSISRINAGNFLLTTTNPIPNATATVSMNQSISYNQSIVILQLTDTTFQIVCGVNAAAADLALFSVLIHKN